MSTPASANPRSRSACPALLISFIILVAATVLAYSDSFSGPFVFDDELSIPGNPTIRQLWPIWPVLTSRQTATVIGRPLLSLSLAVNYAFHGTDVRGYHQFNLAAHILCGVLLFALVRRTLLFPGRAADTPRPPDAAWSPLAATTLAGSAALLWVLHPLNSTPVLYIVQRAELLCALFYLGALYCLVRSAEGSRSALWGSATVACGFLAVLCKEVAATVPLVALLFDGIFLAGSFREVLRRRRWVHAGLFLSWLLLALLMFHSEGRRDTATTGSFIRPLDYALTQFGVVVNYLKLVFWPQPLIFDYGVFVAHGSAEIVPPALFIALLLALTGIALWKAPRAGFLAFITFLILAPTSTIIPLVTHTAAEHRMYLPSAALVVLTVIGVVWLGRQIVSRSSLQNTLFPDVGRFVGIAAVMGVALAFGWLTRARANDYRSAITLWQDTATKRPQNARAFYNLGVELQKAGRTSEAIPAFDRALAQAATNDDPLHKNMVALTYNVRAGAKAALKQFNAAFQDHDLAISLEPQRADFRSHRGQTWGQAGNPSSAAADFTAAIELDPNFAPAWIGRIAADMQLGNFDRAWEDVRHAQALGGDIPPRLLNQLRQLSGRSE